ncbi:peptidoglycan DD-metalloendopeptidase family protein [Paenibacillus sp. sgz5001063]|uniref:peptidoglycan DD-metalloendopeptidase family protein n=1 Tax=Paenibacillus sp. sgz5001063 TaxID=3242474 RepID=UPI0036D385D0
MEQKSDLKGRRKQRIRSLLEQDDASLGTAVPPLFELPAHTTTYKEWGERASHDFSKIPEPDPEALWKQRRNDWVDEGGGDKPRFASGFMRRTIASLIVFGAVWGIFNVQQPWALKAQVFIADALTKDMDFAAAQVWYEEHFNGAPAFIPIFGDKNQPAVKVNAAHDLNAPLEGSIVRPFAATLRGVEIMPAEDSNGILTVKSVDTGRVLSVAKEAEGGIRITVRHTGDVTAEYGHLSGTKLATDDWVQSGDAVGWIQEQENASVPLLFFAIMKDKTYIDPAEVVSFD